MTNSSAGALPGDASDAKDTCDAGDAARDERLRREVGAQFLAELRGARVLAVLRAQQAAGVVDAALTLCAAGMRFVEVALTTPDACSVIAAIRSRAPEGVWIGAGTVLTEDDVRSVAAAGAQFLVTPAVVPCIAEGLRRGLPVLAGAMTPTEAYTAHRLGAAAVKLFPASVGGPAYLRAVRAPLPDLPFVAVGGVGLGDVQPYLRAGAVGVGVGAPLLGDAVSGGDLTGLRERAQAYLAAAGGRLDG